MRKRCRWEIAAPAFLLALALSGVREPLLGQVDWREEARQFGWLLSLSAGQEQARRQHKPLMVVIRCVP